jgi:hypothetical protein
MAFYKYPGETLEGQRASLMRYLNMDDQGIHWLVGLNKKKYRDAYAIDGVLAHGHRKVSKNGSTVYCRRPAPPLVLGAA